MTDLIAISVADIKNALAHSGDINPGLRSAIDIVQEKLPPQYNVFMADICARVNKVVGSAHDMNAPIVDMWAIIQKKLLESLRDPTMTPHNSRKRTHVSNDESDNSITEDMIKERLLGAFLSLWSDDWDAKFLLHIDIRELFDSAANLAIKIEKIRRDYLQNHTSRSAVFSIGYFLRELIRTQAFENGYLDPLRKRSQGITDGPVIEESTEEFIRGHSRGGRRWKERVDEAVISVAGIHSDLDRLQIVQKMGLADNIPVYVFESIIQPSQAKILLNHGLVPEVFWINDDTHHDLNAILDSQIPSKILFLRKFPGAQVYVDGKVRPIGKNSIPLIDPLSDGLYDLISNNPNDIIQTMLVKHWDLQRTIVFTGTKYHTYIMNGRTPEEAERLCVARARKGIEY